MKKFLSILAAAVSALAILSATTAATEVQSVPAHNAVHPAAPIRELPEPVELPYSVPEKESLKYLASRSYAYNGNDLFSLAELLKNAIINGSSSIDISHLKINPNEINLYSLIYYSPYFNEEIDIVPFYSGNYYTTISIYNDMSSDETAEYFALVDRKISDIRSSLVSCKTDLEHALAIHDYLVYNAQYDYDNLVNDTLPDLSYQSAGVIVNGIGVCQSYAYAYMYLMNLEGFECYVTSSDSMNHAWNIVNVGGNYYHVDVTWDDPVPDEPSMVFHDYFLKSDAVFLSGVIPGVSEEFSAGTYTHENWSEDSPECSSTLYDDAYWNPVTGYIFTSGDYSYYIDGYFTKGNYIVKRNNNTGAVTNLAYLGKWRTWNGNGTWVGTFSGFTAKDGELYYNTATEIRKFNPETLVDSLVFAPDVSDGYVYGSVIYGDELYYFISTAPVDKVNMDRFSVMLEKPQDQTNVTLNLNELSIYIGDVYRLVPSGITSDLEWTTSNPAAVTVNSDGVVTAIGVGSATIKVTANNGSWAECVVNVSCVHDFSTWVWETEPTCTVGGIMYRQCSLCLKEERKSVADLGHDKVYHNGKAATCTEDGWMAYETCSRCSYTTFEAILSVGHSFSAWTEISAPSEEKEGVKSRSCSACGTTETATIPKLDHEHEYTSKVTPATCTQVGYTTHSCKCGDSYVDSYVNPLKHDMAVHEVLVESSCTVQGEELLKCKNNNCSYTEISYLPFLDHNEITIEGKNATCMDAGYTESTFCTVCQNEIVPPHVIEALGHDFEAEWTMDVEPTHESEGSKSRHCTRCTEVTDVIAVEKLIAIIDSAKIFTDLEIKLWSKEGIDYVVTYGYMNGTGNGTTFDQTGTMTRAMLVSVLWRMADKPVPQAANPFGDLEAGQTWYHNAVIWAFEHGIVTGTSEVTFAPTGAVTREQMATFLYRYARYMGYDVTAAADLSAFPDEAKVGSWAKDALAWANAEGLITGAKGGDGVTRLDPQGMATREQVATILMRFCKMITE